MASQAIRVAKTAFRSEIKKILDVIPRDVRERESKIITKKLLTHERFIGSHRIAIYSSMEKEVDTKQIIENIFETGKECFIPKYDAQTRHMEMVKVYSLEDFNNLPLSSWNIKQPDDNDHREEAIHTGGLDLMIIPGLAFTRSGLRIGRGRGYYDFYFDRCLHDPHGRPYLIGLAFTEQIFKSIPVDKHDVNVDEVITPDDH